MLCSRCRTNDRREKHDWCQPCVNERKRDRRAERKALGLPPTGCVPWVHPIPLKLRQELAGFARELGFGR